MNTTANLNGTWTLYFGDDDGQILTTALEAKAKGYRKIDAQVPGNVELDLVRAGLEQDPFLADHVLDFEKYEYSNWLFERRFTADRPARPAGAASFRRDQQFANIYSGTASYPETANMLIPCAVDISEDIRWGELNT